MVDTGYANPLPVEVRNNEGSPLPTEPSNIDTLLYSAGLNPSTGSASPANPDLLGDTNQDFATIVRAEIYRRFILTGWVSAAATLTVDIYARATDPNGATLHTGGTGVWFLLGSPSASTTAAGYFRIVLEAADGKFPGFDQYRFCIRSSASATVNLVLRGER
jgi:hypothetical protein